jgi:hypothetical protein
MLAMLIGIAGAGCRESNPAYLGVPGAIDAAKDRPSNGRPDLAAPVDRPSGDSESADLAAPDLGSHDAEVVADARGADAGRDQQAALPDAGVDRTGAPDSSPDAGEVSTVEDAAGAPPDVPPQLEEDGGGADLNVNAGRDVGVDVVFDAGVSAEAGVSADAGVSVSVDAGEDAVDGLAIYAGEDSSATEVSADQSVPSEVGVGDAELAGDACTESQDGSSCLDAGISEDVAATDDASNGG